MLSNNTRRTKVVELSTGTHRWVGLSSTLCGKQRSHLALLLLPRLTLPRTTTPPANNNTRVPDELRKHYLSDGEGGQYSTNLDRNRYGNDDQYLFTGAVGVRSGVVGLRSQAGCLCSNLLLTLARLTLLSLSLSLSLINNSHPLRPGVPAPVPLHGGC
jgi:hypothetical protein